MSTPMKITLRIHIVCRCDECLTKIQSSLLKIGAIVQQDVSKGLFTISTFKPQENVESILRSRLNTRFDIVSTEEINGPDPVQGTTINGNWSVNIGAHGSGNVEVTQSTTVRSNMTQSSHRRDKQAAGETSEPPPISFVEPQPPAGTYGYAPAPSAPLMPESEYEHCPPEEFIREIPLPTRIPEDAKTEAYGDESGTLGPCSRLLFPNIRKNQKNLRFEFGFTHMLTSQIL